MFLNQQIFKTTWNINTTVRLVKLANLCTGLICEEHAGSLYNQPVFLVIKITVDKDLISFSFSKSSCSKNMPYTTDSLVLHGNHFVSEFGLVI